MYQFHILIESFTKNFLRGINGGLSRKLVVHPSCDPSTKFDGSFISCTINEIENNQT
jgi:hypothetical protein